ncbi:MAG TPA: hypothetical protein PKO15_05415 [Fibrobacteria bacterium]|nr:hypothetical protein [Fibrobacteria bacterium]HOX52034.1 hypothetical protein [Fibrobacteria bacterium]
MFFALLRLVAALTAIDVDSTSRTDPTDGGIPGTGSIRQRRIDTIEFIHHGALEGSKVLTPGDSMVYRWAEALRDDILHSRTRRSTVERRILFDRGDILDTLKLQESERILRLERFLADIRIRDTILADGRTLVRVETWDRWSTGVITSLNRSGGVLSWVLGVRESNLLGTGQDVSLSYGQTDGDEAWTIGYTNTALFRRGLKLDAVVSVLTEGHIATFDFGFPAVHRYQTWAWRINGVDQSYQRDLYAPSEVARALTRSFGASWAEDSWISSAPDSRYREVRASLTRLWGDEIRLHSSLFAESELDSVSRPVSTFSFPVANLEAARRDPIVQQWLRRPGHRDDRRLGLELTLKEVRYLRLRNFNNLKWTEDIPVGWSITTTGAWNAMANGEVQDLGYVQTAGTWTGMTGDLYGSGTTSWKSFLDREGGLSQGTLTARTEGRWIPHRMVQCLGSASSASLFGAPGWVSQTTLGEENGLPGWPAHSLAGRGRFLSTAEFRFIPPLEALTMAPALAVFGGTGRVSADPDPLGDGPWRAGLGVGIRVGMTRSPTGLINHLSLSHPVGETDRKMGWLLSFGSYKSL